MQLALAAARHVEDSQQYQEALSAAAATTAAAAELQCYAEFHPTAAAK
jgi:hypothetical protein